MPLFASGSAATSSLIIATFLQIFPPKEEIPYNLAKDVKNNNIYKSCLYSKDNKEGSTYYSEINVET